MDIIQKFLFLKEKVVQEKAREKAIQAGRNVTVIQRKKKKRKKKKIKHKFICHSAKINSSFLIIRERVRCLFFF